VLGSEGPATSPRRPDEVAAVRGAGRGDASGHSPGDPRLVPARRAVCNVVVNRSSRQTQALSWSPWGIRPGADVETAAGPSQHLIDPQGASLLDDESEVMGQMLDRTVDHLAHRPIAPIADDSRPLPRLRW